MDLRSKLADVERLYFCCFQDRKAGVGSEEKSPRESWVPDTPSLYLPGEKGGYFHAASKVSMGGRRREGQ